MHFLISFYRYRYLIHLHSKGYVLILLGLAVCSSVSLAEPETAFHLEEFLNEIRLEDPTIEAARRRWQARAEQVPAVAVLPDPKLNYGYYPSKVETRVGAINQRVGISQKIPFPGKLSLAERKAEEEAQIAMWQYLRLIRSRVTLGKVLYFELNRIDRTRALLLFQLDLAEEMIRTVQTRFESNQAHLPDVLLAEQIMSDLRIQMASLEGARDAVAAQINRLQGKIPDAPVPETISITIPELTDRAELARLAEENHELLKAAAAAVRRDQIMVELTRRDRKPDFNIGLEYTQINSNIFNNPPDNGQDAVMAFFSVNLPIRFRKYEAQEKSAVSSLSASQEGWEASRMDIIAEVIDVYSRATAFSRQIDLYEEALLPQVREAYRASVAGYGAGRDSALKWIESQRNLLEAETGLIFLESELAKTVATLENVAAVQIFSMSATAGRLAPPETEQIQRSNP